MDDGFVSRCGLRMEKEGLMLFGFLRFEESMRAQSKDFRSR